VALTVNHLTKRFGDLVAVNALSFQIRPGEILGLLGPNGSGKTTTARMVLGLLEPDDGEVLVSGVNPRIDPVDVKRRIGYVSEESVLYQSMSPREVYEFVASIRGLDPHIAQERLERYLDGLDEPLTGLDARAVRVFKEIVTLSRERGCSVLFSTHILEVASELCTTVVIINRGKMVAAGTIEELERRAQSAGTRLEDIFLRLTEEDSAVQAAVQRLRDEG